MVQHRQRTVRRPTIEPTATPLPPGQFLAKRWPVLHQGDVPAFDPASWDFRIWGLVERDLALTWPAFSDLPTVESPGDLHCVTRWTKADNIWRGVPAASLLDLAAPLPTAHFAILHGEAGYTANVPVDALREEGVLLATHHGGHPLLPEHGAPVRAVLPRLYAWKSVKWMRGIELIQEDRLGFWEEFGYSSSADAWKEERFADERGPRPGPSRAAVDEPGDG